EEQNNNDQNTTDMLQAFAALDTPAQQQRDAVTACLLAGLSFIGIDATQNTMLAFSAINSDQLCIELAHSIETCLAGRGYGIRALSGPFIQLRAAGTQISVDNLVSALVSFSWSLQAGAGQ
ncbi:MAG TPA: hypothetical protein VGR02_00115, partial [Thermoanaerobaculia bacterium]|nr:hypothetical protein [Thermoanaerobaculia bacterium]